ncbi:MAG: hypothetical protein LBV68_06960 [Spirochaetaceae bacterium]|nr:hypothetical protein [Spirochaetaceae bacterium]
MSLPEKKNTFFDHIDVILSPLSNFFARLNTKWIFVLWFCLFFVFSVLLWGLSTSLRTDAEIKTANKILTESRETRKIREVLSPWLLPGKVTQAGNWYVLNDNNIALIFSVPIDGIFAPFLAIFDDKNTIDKIYPLSRTASRYAEKTSPGILDIWTARITRAALHLNKARRSETAGRY